MRNKAAEKAKGTGPSSNSCSSPVVSQSGNGGNGAPGTNTTGSMGQPGGPLPMHGTDLSALQRPSYSINGILGIPQPDANANINKRKRDDDGKLHMAFSCLFTFIHCLHCLFH